MENNDASKIFIWEFDTTGGGKSLKKNEIDGKSDTTSPIWIHMNASHPETRNWLSEQDFQLDRLTLNALLATETRPRILEVNEGALLILRGVNLNEGAEPEDMVSIRLWIDDKRIISLEKYHIKAVRDIQAQFKLGKGPKNTGDFLVQLIARLFERMEPVLTYLDEATDDIEEKVITVPSVSERNTIIDIRKKAIILRRHMLPQRDVMQYLRVADLPWLDTLQKRHLIESYDRVLRYLENLDAIRERAQIVKDELANRLSDRLNKNMYILSVISAIFLPLGFLTGLLGINIGGIPGADNPQAFLIFCMSLSLLIAIQIWLFKKMKWF